MSGIIILVPAEYLSEAQLKIKISNCNAELNGTPLHRATMYSFAEFKKCKAWNDIYDTVK
jgi:hypothetical protein